jgi:uncharacterized protein (TIGR02246 family)
MTRDEILAIFDRRQTAWRQLDAAALAADHAENGEWISPLAGSVKGRAAIQQVYETWFAALPNVTRQQESLLIDGDRAVEIATVSGTDTGGFMGLPPTGRAFQAPIAAVYVLTDGQITQSQFIYDFTGVLIQIGMLRAKPV